jgi:hypothetical protein
MIPQKTIISYPLTLDTAQSYIKRHFNYEMSETLDDEYVGQLLKVASAFVKGKINGDVCKTKNVLEIKDFTGDEIIINEPNFIDSSTQIINLDASTVITEYDIWTKYTQFKIELESPISSKTDLEVTYYTGFDQNSVPEDIKHAILMKSSQLFADRDGLTYNIKENEAIDTLLNPHKNY